MDTFHYRRSVWDRLTSVSQRANRVCHVAMACEALCLKEARECQRVEGAEAAPLGKEWAPGPFPEALCRRAQVVDAPRAPSPTKLQMTIFQSAVH